MPFGESGMRGWQVCEANGGLGGGGDFAHFGPLRPAPQQLRKAIKFKNFKPNALVTSS